MIRHRPVILALSVACAVGGIATASAAPGTLDPGFDITVDGGSDDEKALDVVVGASGKVYVLDALGGASYKVLRFTANGDLDQTFGSGGGIAFTAANNAFTTGLESFLALAIDEAGGAAYVGGGFGTLASGARFLVKKLVFATGAFDTGYGGSSGRALLDTPGDGAVVRMTFQGAKLLLAGVTGTLGTDAHGDFTIVGTSPWIARLTAAGGVDGTFTQTPIDWGTTEEAPSGITVESGGTILVSGITGLAAAVRGGTGSGLARLAASGGLDADFGSGGTFTKDFKAGTCTGEPTDQVCETIGLYYPQADGAFLMSVYLNRAGDASDQILVQRFTASGTPSGAATAYPAADYLDNGTPALQPDGQVVVAKQTPSDPPNDLRVYRIEGYSVIGHPNTPPVAVNNRITVQEDSSGNVIKPLANDSDADGDPLTISKVTQPAHGQAVVSGTRRQIAYTPAPNFQGKDPFTYTIADGRGGKATATINVTVQNANEDPPDAKPDAFTVAHDAPYTTVPVLVNDTDPDPNPTLTIVAVPVKPVHGTVRIRNGAVQYQPAAGYHGGDSFAYKISDGTLTDRATVTVTVTP